MTDDEFLVVVVRQAPKTLPVEALRAAVTETIQRVRDRRTLQHHINETIVRAGGLQEQFRSVEPPPRATESRGRDISGTDDQCEDRRDQWLRDFEPAVARLRRQLFKAPSAPFRSRAEAAAWCAKQAVPVTAETEVLRFYDTDPEQRKIIVRGVVVSRQSPADSLRVLSESLARMSGFRDFDVTEHILTGATLRLSRGVRFGRIDVIAPGLPSVPIRRQVVITLDERDVTARRFLDVYRQTREFLQRKEKYGRAAKVDRLLTAVKKRGRPPSDFDAAYWTAIVADCRADYRYWRTAATAYQRQRKRQRRR